MALSQVLIWIEAALIPGWPLALAACVLAGMVRGFAGFGTAMIFMPVASTIMPPLHALIVLTVMDLIGPLPLVPRAWREGHPRDVGRIGVGLVVGLPIGLSIMALMAEDTVRWIICALAFAMLPVLVTGWRYRGQVGPRAVYGIGLTAGLTGGAAGMPGPPLILAYMARPLPPATIRATLMLALLLFDVVFGVTLALRGELVWIPIVQGALLTPVFLVAIWAGAALFRPEAEGVFRAVAYAIIAGAAILGMPIWG